MGAGGLLLLLSLAGTDAAPVPERYGDLENLEARTEISFALPTHSWQQVADLGLAAPPNHGSPEPRQVLGVAGLDTKLYAVGGSDGMYRTVASAEVYDPSTNAWASIAQMTTPRRCHGLAALGMKLYAVGGQNAQDSPLASAEVYDPSTDKWATIAPMTQPRTILQMAALGTKLYAVGGCEAPGSVTLASAQEYDPSTNAWASVAQMTTPREGHAVAALGTLLYAVGGEKEGPGGDRWHMQTLASAEVYDPSTDKWAAIAPMTQSRRDFGVASLGMKLYAVGGWNEQGTPFASAEVYDPSTNMWVAIPPMTAARSNVGVAALGTKVYAVGGFGDTRYTLSSVEAFVDDNATESSGSSGSVDSRKIQEAMLV